jgi:hypothetical protein
MNKKNKLAMLAGMMAFVADTPHFPNFGQMFTSRNGTIRNKTDDFEGITIGTYSNTQTAFISGNYRIYALNRRNADRKLAAYKRQNNITD